MEKQERIGELKYELNVEKQRGAMADAGKIAEIEQQIAEIEQAEAAEQMAYILDNLRVGDSNIQEFFLNATEERANISYEVVRDAVQGLLLDREQYWKEQHDQIQSQYELERSEREKLQASETAGAEANVKLVAELNDTLFLLEDAESKRDAAVAQSEEKDATIDKLNKEITELKKQLSVASVATPKTVDTGDSYARWKEQRQKEDAERPAIYNVREGDRAKTFYLAQLAETDEEIRIPWMFIKNYREVSAEEAPQFRISEEPKRVDEGLARTDDVEEGNELTPPTWQFPEGEAPTESAGHQLAQEQLAGSVAEETAGEVTRAEFEELKRRVSALEVPQAEVA